MNCYFLLLFAVAIATLNTVESETFCFTDQMLTPEGECVDCDKCPSGEGVDTEEKIQVNEDGTALECRTCKLCPDGYWNNQIYEQMECMKCRLNCLAMNRKVYEHCGGSNQGQCGACINSEYEDIDQNIESPCVKRSTPVTSNVRSFAPTTSEVNTVSNNITVTEIKSDKSVDRTSRESADSDSLKIGQAAVLTVAGVLFIALLYISYYLWKHRTRSKTASPELGSSGDSMLSKDSSLLGEHNLANKHDLSTDHDLESDCLLTVNEARVANPHTRRPHPELPSNRPSAGPDAMSGRLYNNFKKNYPDFLLKMDDEYVHLASRNIYDEGKYKPMFRDLGVSEQDMHAQYDLFFLEKQSYDLMIRWLLNKWIKLAGRGATLKILCTALDEHEFPNVAAELMNLYTVSLASTEKEFNSQHE